MSKIISLKFENGKTIEVPVHENVVDVFVSLRPNETEHLITSEEMLSKQFFSEKITGSPDYDNNGVAMQDGYSKEISTNHDEHTAGNTIVKVSLILGPPVPSGERSQYYN